MIKGLEHAAKLADVLADIEMSGMQLEEKVHCIRALAGTILTVYLGHIQKEHRANEIIKLLDRVRHLVDIAEEEDL